MKAENIAYMIAKLRLGSSRPLALWFVDRPAMYYGLLREQGDCEVTFKEFKDRELAFYGIPLRKFYPREVTEEELEARPLFCKQPGVWIEMSDGDHVRLQDEEEVDPPRLAEDNLKTLKIAKGHVEAAVTVLVEEYPKGYASREMLEDLHNTLVTIDAAGNYWAAIEGVLGTFVP